MAKVPTEITIDIDELALLVAAAMQETVLAPMIERLDALETGATDTDAKYGTLTDGVDGLRIALQEWANIRPPE